MTTDNISKIYKLLLVTEFLNLFKYFIPYKYNFKLGSQYSVLFSFYFNIHTQSHFQIFILIKSFSSRPLRSLLSEPQGHQAVS